MNLIIEDPSNRLYIPTKQNPEGELITNREVTRFLKHEIKKAEKKGYSQGYEDGVNRLP